MNCYTFRRLLEWRVQWVTILESMPLAVWGVVGFVGGGVLAWVIWSV